MKRVLLFALVVALIATAAAQQDPLRRLQQIADSSNGGDCARYSVALASRLVEIADKQYEDGKVSDAEQSIKLTGHYAERGALCSIQSRKHEKDTEIGLRKLSKRLTDIEKSLAFEDRPLLRQQTQNIDRLREQLLTSMFGGKTAQALKTNP
ncbi:MAG TPA: hypothetical protein VF786_15245 [Terriglobales bacterium]